MSNWETWASLVDEVINLIIGGFTLAKIIRNRRNRDNS